MPPIAAIGDKKNSNFVSNLSPNIEIDVFMRGTSDVGDTELFFGKLVPLIYSTLTSDRDRSWKSPNGHNIGFQQPASGLHSAFIWPGSGRWRAWLGPLGV